MSSFGSLMHSLITQKISQLICILWTISVMIDMTNGDIAVISPNNRTVDVFVDFELGFAASVPSEGILGRFVVGQPEDGCSQMAGPPQTNQTGIKWFVLVKRYPCQFTTKVQNAMNAGFDAVIIYNIDVMTVKKYSLVHSPQSAENGVTIPALLISFEDGWTLKKEYLWTNGFYLMILPDLPFNLNAYLLPFAIVIAVCLILMISFMIFQIVKCYRERKRRQRHRLSSRHLKQIPIQKYRKGDQYDTCAICLEEYVDGEKLRILPCGHAYHMKCIDPWLTKNRRVCPVCKGKVVLPGMSDISDTESESEAHHTGANERTPLLFADRAHTRHRSRRRRRSYPQTSASNEQTNQTNSEMTTNSEIIDQTNVGQSATDNVVNVSASAPNVRLVEVDIVPMMAPTCLSVNCDSEESIVEMADDVNPMTTTTVITVSAPQTDTRASRNRRQDVIV
ncbi:E3 ubiquitin-protein ligase RNF13-like isoform X2 [Oppia nitens]|uniref:E3 ubiquitin-protein ligase RNF13-like isoform X2 n=1 Tax=Oppia nitens TaxID=1686743 RepID=UPI0023DA7F37|nr:E3 ubiquitin-protein ligase RNF13-like isoform X2 [Oppia nitens]